MREPRPGARLSLPGRLRNITGASSGEPGLDGAQAQRILEEQGGQEQRPEAGDRAERVQAGRQRASTRVEAAVILSDGDRPN
jgi:hypothetical protein